MKNEALCTKLDVYIAFLGHNVQIIMEIVSFFKIYLYLCEQIVKMKGLYEDNIDTDGYRLG